MAGGRQPVLGGLRPAPSSFMHIRMNPRSGAARSLLMRGPGRQRPLPRTAAPRGVTLSLLHKPWAEPCWGPHCRVRNWESEVKAVGLGAWVVSPPGPHPPPPTGRENPWCQGSQGARCEGQKALELTPRPCRGAHLAGRAGPPVGAVTCSLDLLPGPTSFSLLGVGP